MRNEKEEIDKLIKQALTEEEAAFYDELEEQGLVGKLNNVFKGKMGWLVVVMNIISLFAFVFFVYCIVQFFDTVETKELIKWSAAGFLGLIFIGLIKVYVWLQMDKNDILRELKRLELQISSLAAKRN